MGKLFVIFIVCALLSMIIAHDTMYRRAQLNIMDHTIVRIYGRNSTIIGPYFGRCVLVNVEDYDNPSVANGELVFYKVYIQGST